MNFFNNTGSMFLIFLGMVINWLFWKALSKMSFKYYRNRYWRKIGIYSSQSISFRLPILSMASESYLDLILGCYLGTFDILRSVADWGLFKNNFSNFSNTLLTITTIIVTVLITVLPFYMKHHIEKNYKELNEKRIKEEFGVFYSEYRIDSQHRALYGYYSLVRRLVLVLILVLLDD